MYSYFRIITPCIFVVLLFSWRWNSRCTKHNNDNKLSVGGIFHDLEKSFDCMNHDILLLKLKFYGVIGKAYILIKSYLKDRYQRVLIDNRHYNSISSDWAKVKHDVPQGSVLSPSFFLLCVNDL
jgi:hypothetical protein